MGRKVPLREDYNGNDLRRLARFATDGDHVRRLLSIASIYDGGTRSEAARLGCVGLQIIRDWVERFNKEGSDGLKTHKAPGAVAKLTDDICRALGERVEAGPDLDSDGLVRWRLKDLSHWIFETYGVSVEEDTVSRTLKKLGFCKISARPRHHKNDPLEVEDLKKTPRQSGRDRESPCPETEIEIWFQDEARVGQKTKITRRWAKRGSRPRALVDQRTTSAYIFGAVCPKKGTGAGLIMPSCNTSAMEKHLIEISKTIAPKAHAILILDKARWHTSPKLKVPENISLLFLPSYSPELNPHENIWQFMRDNWLSNIIFTGYNDILDHCCRAWNNLINLPHTITSIANRSWLNEF